MEIVGHGFESFLSVANIPQDPHDVELSGNRQSKLFDGEEDYGVFVYVCMCVHVGDGGRGGVFVLVWVWKWT